MKKKKVYLVNYYLVQSNHNTGNRIGNFRNFLIPEFSQQILHKFNIMSRLWDCMHCWIQISFLRRKSPPISFYLNPWKITSPNYWINKTHFNKCPSWKVFKLKNGYASYTNNCFWGEGDVKILLLVTENNLRKY